MHGVISSVADIQRLVNAYVARAEPVYIDIETTGLNPRKDRVVAIQMQQGTRAVVIIDCRSFTRQHVAVLKPLFASNLLFVGHNIKFDYSFLAQRGLRMRTVFCTQIAEQIIHAVGLARATVENKPVNLAAVAKRRLGIDIDKSERANFHTIGTEPFTEAAIAYMVRDVEVLPQIYQQQLEELGSQTDVAKMEMRCLLGIAEMELAGISIDVEGWRIFIAQKKADAVELEDAVLAHFGLAMHQAREAKYQQQLQAYNAAAKKPPKPRRDTSLLNIKSWQQLLPALHLLGIDAVSTSSAHLQELAHQHAGIEVLLAHRKTEKFVDSFGESLLAKVEDGRLHPDYVQIGASTGRMSCRNPNFQQIPSRGDGLQIRKLVVAKRGCKLITADFSNVELRILAEYSKDATMLKIFADGLDMHSETARLMFNLDGTVDVKTAGPFAGVSYRDIAKTINFGLVYGMSAKRLGQTLQLELAQAEALMAKYFSLYGRVAQWLAQQRKIGYETSQSTTLLGRKRFYQPLPEPQKRTYVYTGQTYNPQLFERNGNQLVERWDVFKQRRSDWFCRKGQIERQAGNSPIQGTSADITKLAVAEWHARNHSPARLVAVVHDEMVVEAPDAAVPYAGKLLIDVMHAAWKSLLPTVTLPLPDAVVEQHWAKKGNAFIYDEEDTDYADELAS